MIADLDLGSEGWRWMGPSIRYLLAPVYRLAKKRKYPGRLWYLPAESEDMTPCVSPCQTCHEPSSLSQSHCLFFFNIFLKLVFYSYFLSKQLNQLLGHPSKALMKANQLCNLHPHYQLFLEKKNLILEVKSGEGLMGSLPW